MWTLLKQKSLQISVIVLLVSGLGFLVHKATSKDNTQNITAEAGSSVTIHTQVADKDSSGISLNVGVERTVSGENNGETVLTTGISYKF